MATILRDSAVVLVGACPQEDYEKSLFHLVHWARHERNLRDKKMATQDPRGKKPASRPQGFVWPFFSGRFLLHLPWWTKKKRDFS